MRKHIPHPVIRVVEPYATLDILHGGNEYSAVEESLVIARDLRDALKDDENILYVNTLVSELRLGYAAGKRFDHGERRNRNFFITYCSGELIDKLKVVRAVIASKKIKYVVITGFEIVALSSRHRVEFMAWIRELRNAGVNIILFTITCPGRCGALGALRYSARTIAEVGAYLKQKEEPVMIEEPIENEQEFEADIASEDAAIEDAASVDSRNEEIEESGVYVEMQTDNADHSEIFVRPRDKDEAQHSDSGSLKTKDLALELV